MKCCFCNNDEAKEIIKPSGTFTDYDILKTKHICSFCNSIYKDAKYRRSCWILNNKDSIFFSKDKILENILNIKIKPPFKVFITTSYKKHGYYKTVWNYSLDNFQIRFDDLDIDFGKEKAIEILNIIETFYYNGFIKKEIESGKYNIKKLLTFGKDKWLENERKIKLMRGTPLFKFLLYCINPKRKDE